ncbi:MAG: diaminopimelate epimerase [Dehalococcoidia bacterium]
MDFHKIQGTGNDFIVCHDLSEEETNWAELATKVCNRRFGIGADGLILVKRGTSSDISMRMFNPDGTESEMCGNGIRCVAKFAYDEGLVDNPSNITIATGSGIYEVWSTVDSNGKIEKVRVDMNKPIVEPSKIPVTIDSNGPIIDYPVNIHNNDLNLSFISMGNPHAIHFYDGDLESVNLEDLGPQVESHLLFPNKTNFEIVNVLNKESLKVRVWERGAGITLACGSGACASFAAAHLKGLVGNRADVELPGGTLVIEWDGEGSVYMTGSVETVFTGNI